MHTIKAMKLIGEAVRLADSGFEGDCLKEACKGADPLDREMVCTVVGGRLAQLGKMHASRDELVEVLRQVALA